MRIGVLTQWYDPEPGPAALPGVLARELTKRGHEVHVLTGFPNYPTGQLAPGYRLRPYLYEQVDGVHIHRSWLLPQHSQSALGRMLNYFSFGFSAATNAWHLPPLDVLWVNYSPITTSFAQWTLNLLQGVPTVIEIGDLWPDTVMVSKLDGSRLIERVYGLLDRWVKTIYRSSDAIVVISPGVAEVLEQRGVSADRVVYIPKWADEGVFHPAGKPRRHQYSIAEDDRVLLYAGAMGQAQGLERLVKSFAKVSTDYPQFKLLLVGSGTQQEKLRQLAERLCPHQVQFRGRVSQNQMTDLLASVDAVYIGLRPHPLSAFTMPSKTQSSLAAGKMIVLDAQGDVNRVVAKARAGLVNHSGSEEELQANLRCLAQMGDVEVARHGANARAYYQRNFSVEHTVDRYERLLRVMSRRHRPWWRSSQPRVAAMPPANQDIAYRPLHRSDAPAAARLHYRAFPGFFLSSLGPRFLAQLYRGYASDPTSFGTVATKGDVLVGVYVGTTDPRGFYGRLLRRRLGGFAITSALAALHHPTSIPRLLRAVGYRGDGPAQKPNYALLASICVDPASRGLGVGKQLLRDFAETAAKLGAPGAYLQTDAVNNDAVNRLYQASGWELADSYTTPEGRHMNRYEIELQKEA